MNNPSIFDPVPLQPKIITLRHVQHFLEQVRTYSASLTLSRKAAIINNIARYLFIATQNWMGELHRVRHAICYESMANQVRKKRVGATTSHKKMRKST